MPADADGVSEALRQDCGFLLVSMRVLCGNSDPLDEEYATGSQSVRRQATRQRAHASHILNNTCSGTVRPSQSSARTRHHHHHHHDPDRTHRTHMGRMGRKDAYGVNR